MARNSSIQDSDAATESKKELVRDSKGRFPPGYCQNPGGRTRIPDWLKEKGPDALRTILAVATGITDGCNQYQIETMLGADARSRLLAAESVVARVYGPPIKAAAIEPKQDEGFDLIKSKEDLVKAAESKLFTLAEQGDLRALELILKANDPKYSTAQKQESNEVDTLDFVPMVGTLQ